VVKMPPEEGAAEGAEVMSHDYRVFPVDGLWCSDAMHDFYKSRFWSAGQFVLEPQVQDELARCTAAEDKETTQLLQPYIVDLDFKLQLTSLFAYAPRDIARRNNSTGGDSPLGNVAADSMRKRRRVEAEVAVTNSLGIRDNLYAGPLTQESMFNVFPFENTINVMYLSGTEMQEMFDFISERSASRGCVSQAQISGARFTMDCAQVQLNDLRLSCEPKNGAADCPSDDRTDRAAWQCLEDVAGNRCWAHPATMLQINGQPLDTFATYRVAVNDYIAKGGSGFVVLKRNTTRIETGIPLRDSLIGYLESFCSCDDLLADKRDGAGNVIGKNGQLCGNLLGGRWTVDSQELAFCRSAKTYQDALKAERGPTCACIDIFRGNCAATRADVQACQQALPAGPVAGKCTCRDALASQFQDPIWAPNTLYPADSYVRPPQPNGHRYRATQNVTSGADQPKWPTLAGKMDETGSWIEVADPPCGNITAQVRSYCENPTAVAIALGIEDGRIGRRVK
jgi:5'-nucleotidase/UDP-sugar diphosphatase